MDSLNNTTWDVVIAGTGLQESLLALALSRSGKQVLHVDKSAYYGGAEATLNLQDAEAWVDGIERCSDESVTFSHASIACPASENISSEDGVSLVSSPRAYSLALGPQLVLARSRLLKTLVSARVDQQLEFLAAGHWWVYKDGQASQELASNDEIWKVPMGREDIFADHQLDMRVKRSLMKFLRFMSNLETSSETLAEHASLPVTEFMSSQFGLPSQVQQSLLALSLTSSSLEQTLTSYAIPRIAAYLRSMNELGPGFGAVIPKWGGLAEVSQVSCRAGAVGGGVYSLSNGVAKLTSQQPEMSSSSDVSGDPAITVSLESGDEVKTHHIVGSLDNIAAGSVRALPPLNPQLVSRTVSIVSSPLKQLFPPPSEGAPNSAVATVRMSSDISDPNHNLPNDIATTTPIYLMIHSSDTGECPVGQSVVYASVMLPRNKGYVLLEKAINQLLAIHNQELLPRILWKLQYEQRCPSPTNSGDQFVNERPNGGIHIIEPRPFDLAFDDGILDSVEAIWRRILGSDATGFMQFERREGDAYDEDYYT